MKKYIKKEYFTDGTDYKTTSLSIGKLNELITRYEKASPSDTGDYGRCPVGSTQVGKCTPDKPGGWVNPPYYPLCISNSRKCPAMQNGIEGTLDNIDASNIYSPAKGIALIDLKGNTCKDPWISPDWRTVLAGIDKGDPIYTCLYPRTAVPTDDQALVLAEHIQDGDNKRLLSNYCFSEETDKTRCPGNGACIRASSRTEVCKKLGDADNALYDNGVIDYCRKVYNTNKDNPSFDYGSVGCQCVYDTTINPNQDKTLKALLTTMGVHEAPHCIWGPCLETSSNLKLYSDLKDTCAELSCASIINSIGSQIDTSSFNQNVQCTGDKKIPVTPIIPITPIIPVTPVCSPACTGDTTCDKESKTCVPISCSTDNDCPNSKKCISNKCGSKPADVPSSSVCSPTCTGDTTCSKESKTCVPISCSTDNDCPNSKKCISNKCGSKPADVPPTSVCYPLCTGDTTCDSESKTCVPFICSVDTDCPNSKKCGNDKKCTVAFNWTTFWKTYMWWIIVAIIIVIVLIIVIIIVISSTSS